MVVRTSSWSKLETLLLPGLSLYSQCGWGFSLRDDSAWLSDYLQLGPETESAPVGPLLIALLPLLGVLLGQGFWVGHGGSLEPTQQCEHSLLVPKMVPWFIDFSNQQDRGVYIWFFFYVQDFLNYALCLWTRMDGGRRVEWLGNGFSR